MIGDDVAAVNGRDDTRTENARLLAELVTLKKEYNRIARENLDLLGEQCALLVEELAELEKTHCTACRYNPGASLPTSICHDCRDCDMWDPKEGEE